ncbi:hypothetical protein AMC83_CH04150 [Rhizobium phaseoli]|nr:hypothetical protein AMC83_CH04150 [Rhizobium phaseoli]
MLRCGWVNARSRPYESIISPNDYTARNDIRRVSNVITLEEISVAGSLMHIVQELSFGFNQIFRRPISCVRIVDFNQVALRSFQLPKYHVSFLLACVRPDVRHNDVIASAVGAALLKRNVNGGDGCAW